MFAERLLHSLILVLCSQSGHSPLFIRKHFLYCVTVLIHALLIVTMGFAPPIDRPCLDAFVHQTVPTIKEIRCKGEISAALASVFVVAFRELPIQNLFKVLLLDHLPVHFLGHVQSIEQVMVKAEVSELVLYLLEIVFQLLFL